LTHSPPASRRDAAGDADVAAGRCAAGVFRRRCGAGHGSMPVATTFDMARNAVRLASMLTREPVRLMVPPGCTGRHCLGPDNLAALVSGTEWDRPPARDGRNAGVLELAVETASSKNIAGVVRRAAVVISCVSAEKPEEIAGASSPAHSSVEMAGQIGAVRQHQLRVPFRCCRHRCRTCHHWKTGAGDLVTAGKAPARKCHHRAGSRSGRRCSACPALPPWM